jgi:hypothetical protein
MSLADLTSRDAVLAAIAEYDTLGQDRFLAQYGFHPARRYWLVHNGRRYDSKAVVAAAHGFQFPDAGPFRAAEFSGGDATVARKLRSLGFSVENNMPGIRPLPPLSVGRTYSWDELAPLFEFQPDYLGAAGGMVPRPDFNALLLITHPGGGMSFDYDDYWAPITITRLTRDQIARRTLRVLRLR